MKHFTDFDDGMRMNGDITLEQYLKILEKAKQCVMDDLRSFDTVKLKEQGIFSFLGLHLRNRDDEDAQYITWSSGYEHFTRFDSNVITHMRDECEYVAEDIGLPIEEAKKKFYWEVERFDLSKDSLKEVYTVSFSLDGEYLGVRMGKLAWFIQKEDFQELPENLQYLMKMKQQLYSAANVSLSYRPGNILYVDAEPFGKPFFAVFCSETGPDKEHFEWTLSDYGYHRRDNYCLYLSEDHGGLSFTSITGNFTDYIAFPYCPLDRISVVDSCDDKDLMKCSRLLKQNPDVFYDWLKRYENGEKKLAI